MRLEFTQDDVTQWTVVLDDMAAMVSYAACEIRS